MNISAPFIARPVATTLLTIAIALAGLMGFSRLPVSPLPQVDFPTISVSATLPGASPETVSTSVAEPLERHLGQIADVTEMTSQSGIGQARITLQFDVSRDIDGAARDVAGGDQRRARRLADQPAEQSDLPQSQSGRCADLDPGADLEDDDAGPDVRRREQHLGAAAVATERHRQRQYRRLEPSGGARRAQPAGAVQLRHRARGRARRACLGQRQQPEGHDRRRQPAFSDLHQRPGERCRRLRAAGDCLPQRRSGPPHRRRRSLRLRSGQSQSRHVRRPAFGSGHPLPSAERQHHRDRRRREGGAAASGSGHAGRHERHASPSIAAPRSAPRCTTPN